MGGEYLDNGLRLSTDWEDIEDEDNNDKDADQDPSTIAEQKMAEEEIRHTQRSQQDKLASRAIDKTAEAEFVASARTQLSRNLLWGTDSTIIKPQSITVQEEMIGTGVPRSLLIACGASGRDGSKGTSKFFYRWRRQILKDCPVWLTEEKRSL